MHSIQPIPSETQYTAIGPFKNERALRDAALVLNSVAVPHVVTYRAGGGHLIVQDADYDRARENLDRYEEENKDFPPERPRERAYYAGAPLVPLLFVAFVLFSMVTGPSSRPQGPWLREGASVAELVLGGEPFRAVTALSLHGDGAHVMGNLVSGAIFGRALERRIGPGAALFSILSVGAVGNVVNAAFYLARDLPHASIGASTAVFSAIGLLAVTQLTHGSRHIATPTRGRHWTEYAAPVIGALALLGALGSSPDSDIWAHAFGLAAGLVLGVPIALVARRYKKARFWPQLLWASLGLALLGGSWALALRDVWA